jgi:phosphatidylinositol alpha-1,6-mannosyltransferase
LALVADAFAGHGGIAEFNRHLLSTLAACDSIAEVIILPRLHAKRSDPLPRHVVQLRPVPGRIAYSLTALRTAITGRFDIVFCGHLSMAPLAAVIAKLRRIPLWVQVHGVEAWEELSAVHRRSVEAAALVTSVSRYTRRRLLEWVSIDPARLRVLPNTVDSRFQPGPKPAYLLDRHSAWGRRVIMTVSRLATLERYKGHDRVITLLPEILSVYPDTIYLIVGDGDDRPRLETLSAALGLAEKVQFVGQVSGEELPDYFRVADVFVMPSTGEGFGIAFLEALACGIPVIGGNQDGSLDALCDGALGTAIRPEDRQELSSAMKAVLGNPVRGGNRAERFILDAFSAHAGALLGICQVKNGAPSRPVFGVKQLVGACAVENCGTKPKTMVE